MEIISAEDCSIQDIAARLKKGEVIVYPTETCYGLGADATNQKAVDKVFAIKQRTKEMPVLVVSHDMSVMNQYVQWNAQLEEIDELYWPGPLTAVAHVQPEVKIADGVLASDNTIAFRITAHELASEIAAAMGTPLVSTSANITKQEVPYGVQSVIDMFKNEECKPDLIIDSGELPHLSPSTIVRVTESGLEVLRQGAVIIE